MSYTAVKSTERAYYYRGSFCCIRRRSHSRKAMLVDSMKILKSSIHGVSISAGLVVLTGDDIEHSLLNNFVDGW